MGKKEKAPCLRFKDTNGKDYPAWEQRKLNEIASIYDGTHQTPRYTSNGIPFLSVENITTLQSSKFISEKDFLRDFPVYPKKGDVLLTRIGDVGTANVYERNQKVAFYVSLALLKLRETDPYFVNASFRSNSTRKEVWKRTLHIAFPKKINKNEIGKVNIQIPSLAEQRKIGIFFYSLDRLITLHQRKLETLKKLKRTLLQKMFPKKGQLKPELRFPGFTNDWEQRNLFDYIQKITDFRGRTPKKLGMEWSEKGIPALSALNVKDGYIDLSQDIHFGNQKLYKKWMAGNELHKGQVLFTTEAPMGNVAQVPDNKKYILSQRTIAFDVKKDILSEDFLAILLRSPSVFRELTALSTGGTAKGVSQKTLAGVKVKVPKLLEEQKEIAELFSRMNGCITLHQRKLETYKKLKKSLLQKMFI